MRKKLCSPRGETLVESLCAILVITLVFVFLCGAIVSAARANKQIRDSNQSFTFDYETQNGQAQGTALRMTVSDGFTESTYPVTEYVVTPENQSQDYAKVTYRYYTTREARK